jgi:hypothetical protein
LTSRDASDRTVALGYAIDIANLKEREKRMADEQDGATSPPHPSWRQWLHLVFPEARMRVATRRRPRDWFELLTRVPVVERIVIKRFVENITCDQWLKEPHSDLHGLDPMSAAKDTQSRVLLESLLTRITHNREKTPRQLRRIRRHLGM